MKRILVLSPHTDDVELGAGGFLARYSQSYEVIYVALCKYPRSDSNLPRNTYLRESNGSLDCFGIPDNPFHRRFFDFEIRSLPERRQDVLQVLINLRNELKPELVLCPSSTDIHQDHQVVHQECLRCFKHQTTILGYELSWNHFSFTNNYYIELQESHLHTKLLSLACYESQKTKSYFSGEFQRSLMRVRGVQSGFELAECFEAIRIVEGIL